MSETLVNTAPGQVIRPGRAYRIRGGRVVADPRPAIPATGIRLPTLGTGSYSDDPDADPRRAMPATRKADEEDEDLEWSLDALAELQGRLTPWTTWWVAPRWRHDDAHPWLRERGWSWVGLAFRETGEALLSSSCSAVGILSVACHEAWHLVEPYLSEEEIDAVGAVVLGSTAKEWPCAYHDLEAERRARLFQRWADFMFEGGEHSFRDGTAQALFAAFWSGDIGREVLSGKRRYRAVEV